MAFQEQIIRNEQQGYLEKTYSKKYMYLHSLQVDDDVEVFEPLGISYKWVVAKIKKKKKKKREVQVEIDGKTSWVSMKFVRPRAPTNLEQKLGYQKRSNSQGGPFVEVQILEEYTQLGERAPWHLARYFATRWSGHVVRLNGKMTTVPTVRTIYKCNLIWDRRVSKLWKYRMKGVTSPFDNNSFTLTLDETKVTNSKVTNWAKAYEELREVGDRWHQMQGKFHGHTKQDKGEGKHLFIYFWERDTTSLTDFVSHTSRTNSTAAKGRSTAQKQRDDSSSTNQKEKKLKIRLRNKLSRIFKRSTKEISELLDDTMDDLKDLEKKLEAMEPMIPHVPVDPLHVNSLDEIGRASIRHRLESLNLSVDEIDDLLAYDSSEEMEVDKWVELHEQVDHIYHFMESPYYENEREARRKLILEQNNSFSDMLEKCPPLKSHT